MAANVNYSEKYISCSGSFSICMLQTRKQVFKHIPVKIIAGYEVWGEWLNQYLDNPDKITLEAIRPHLFRPKQSTLFWLERFANDSPDSFLWQFYSQFLNEVDAVNPDRENRKIVIPGRDKLTHDERQEMFRLSRWLYVFLQYWKEQAALFTYWKPAAIFPEELKSFCARYDYRFNSKRPLYVAVAQALSVYYQDDNLFTDDGTSLYHNHIKGKTKRIKDALTSTNFLPSGTPIESFLKK